ncbi:serine beta-lactamase-like protein LACTB, mitochondrial isoform X1 [Microcaecilia unicolor]|uniref:Serine beta-lactamase-like protein LACTB, mitochondrial isoform X1 n=1 Tax=Microcaecilia unicolor TaxID=1415580 RepID=A0A6P7WUR6_9AMPH|nr:serine beta-lactamase-like protein LACTB, mitochondrial isoform X1 [Microcaecilia unicolor]
MSHLLRPGLDRVWLTLRGWPRGAERLQHCSSGPLNSERRRWGWLLGLGLGLGLVVSVRTPECESEEKAEKRRQPFARAIAQSRDLLQKIKDESGAPGIVVGVSVDGKEVWSKGLGFADVENRVPCKPATVMRIASISKSLTMMAVARLWQEGKLDLDAPVQKYVPEFPEKEFEGEKVTITTRMLVSHLSGIRHYEKDVQAVRDEKASKASKRISSAPNVRTGENVNMEKESNKVVKNIAKTDAAEAKPEEDSESKEFNSRLARRKREFDKEEYYLKEKFKTVIDSLELFKNDPLVFKPGSQFLYSTHAWTLVSAVVERASERKFVDYMKEMFHDLGMDATIQEEHEPLIYNRARFYVYNKKGHLANVPYVDNSYKLAGGGFLSTVSDLLIFGNALLYSYQLQQFSNSNGKLLPGYLKPETTTMMWLPVPNTEMSSNKDGKYGMGWGIVEKKQEYGQCRLQQHYVSHSGAAVGASSVLLILPEDLESVDTSSGVVFPPRGVVVSIICNMQSTSLNSTARNIALEFAKDKAM